MCKMSEKKIFVSPAVRREPESLECRARCARLSQSVYDVGGRMLPSIRPLKSIVDF